MKCIIAGSRSFSNYSLLENKMDAILSSVEGDIIIISGGARGADYLGERYAKERQYKCIIMPAKWDEHGKRAGILRNYQMADIADACVCFWDGESNGTKNMIKFAKELDLKLRVVRF